MKEKPTRVNSPFSDTTIAKLKVGTYLLLSGTIYVGRDTAHRRLVQSLDKGEKLPFDIKGQTIYYMGPSPARPGHIIGSAGPTTSSRMDIFTPRLLEAGLKAMIGKGNRSQAVREAIKKYGAAYLVATGGAAALISKSIIKSETIAYEELGAEALLKLTVKDLTTQVETAPDAAPTVAVYQSDGTTELLAASTATLTAQTTAQYYYDWQISTSLTASERLIALWEWTANSKPHKVKQHFNVVTLDDYQR